MKNQEIKFRAQKVGDKKMLFGNIITDGVVPVAMIEQRINPISNRCATGWCFAIKSETVGRYTGRKDVNGKEIYDGDVLKHHGIVKWDNEYHEWTAIDLNWNDKREVHDLDYLTSPFEVIGNIHENPELII